MLTKTWWNYTEKILLKNNINIYKDEMTAIKIDEYEKEKIIKKGMKQNCFSCQILFKKVIHT